MRNSRVVAIACEDGAGLNSEVSGHFGHTPFFLVALIRGSTAIDTRTVKAPGHGEGCRMPDFVERLGAQALVVGGLGAGAAARLDALGVEVFAGASGPVGDALRAICDQTLAQNEASCAGGGSEGHACGHHGK